MRLIFKILAIPMVVPVPESAEQSTAKNNYALTDYCFWFPPLTLQ